LEEYKPLSSPLQGVIKVEQKSGYAMQP